MTRYHNCIGRALRSKTDVRRYILGIECLAANGDAQGSYGIAGHHRNVQLVHRGQLLQP